MLRLFAPSRRALSRREMRGFAHTLRSLPSMLEAVDIVQCSHINFADIAVCWNVLKTKALRGNVLTYPHPYPYKGYRTLYREPLLGRVACRRLPDGLARGGMSESERTGLMGGGVRKKDGCLAIITPKGDVSYIQVNLWCADRTICASIAHRISPIIRVFNEINGLTRATMHIMRCCGAPYGNEA